MPGRNRYRCSQFYGVIPCISHSSALVRSHCCHVSRYGLSGMSLSQIIHIDLIRSIVVHRVKAYFCQQLVSLSCLKHIRHPVECECRSTAQIIIHIAFRGISLHSVRNSILDILLVGHPEISSVRPARSPRVPHKPRAVIFRPHALREILARKIIIPAD